ncbi:hypothetical protein [Defluviimonas sp. SAOS-178_SWC]|uniref:hypothetical protein n=1 Tax=Defluviimonas sp. SAOS-178_SWC TaxID=3121287 RepID=UPI003D80AD29
MTEVNEPALRAAGLARGDIVGLPFWDCYWWNFDRAAQDRLREAVARAAMANRPDTMPRSGSPAIGGSASTSSLLPIVIRRARSTTSLRPVSTSPSARRARLGSRPRMTASSTSSPTRRSGSTPWMPISASPC